MSTHTVPHNALKSAATGVGDACNSIRLGLLVDDQFAPRWLGELIQNLHRDPAVELEVVAHCAGARATSSLQRSILFRLWAKLDEWTFKESIDPLARDSKQYNVETITLHANETGRLEPSAADLARIQALDLDLLIQLGSFGSSDAFSNYTRHGVWTFQYDGYTPAQIGTALFWNLFEGRPTSEFALVSSNGDRQVLYRGVVSNDLISLHRNLVVDSQRRSQILLRYISELSRKGWSGIAKADTGDLTVVRTQGASVSRTMPRFIARCLTRAAKRLWARLAFREQWFLAYGKGNIPAASAIFKKTGMSDCLTLMKHPGVGNYADPFLFERNGKTYLFFEEYDEDQPGIICCAEFQADGALGSPQRVLTRNYRLSYPFVFESRGQVYMLPETQDNRTIEVYGSVQFPYRWELAAVLLSNVSAVDPTIFQDNGRLWLFAAGLGGQGTESNELSLFWADSLFGRWHPHPKNPIVRDVRRARPAGSLFFEQGSLIRPGQDCGARYGGAISLNRVDELSETDYREVPVATILPDWMDGICATHTLNRLGGMTVLDARVQVPRVPLFRRTVARRS